MAISARPSRIWHSNDTAPIEVDEFRTLNRCLDNGIADAVTEFARSATPLMAEREALALNERLGSFAHDLRGLTQTAMLAVAAIKTGNVGLTGATGAILDRSLEGLRRRIDRVARRVASNRRTAAHEAIGLRLPTSSLRSKTSASLDALCWECPFTVAEVEQGRTVEGDRDMLLTAVENLLQNAFKFTKPGTEVSLNARSAGDRVVIEVADHCGGLPRGGHEKLFLPFTADAA